MKYFSVLFFLLLSVIFNIIYADDAYIKRSLKKLGINESSIYNSPIAELKIVLTKNGIIYITNDGKYIVKGLMYDISGKQPINITNSILMKKLNSLEKEMIIYKAPQEKHVITVFTDIECEYCRKMHKQIKEYNSLGITVRYLAFPKEEIKNKNKKNMQLIWCALDRKKAFDAVMNGSIIEQQYISCNIDLSKHYELGLQFNVTGTPVSILSNGYLILGYHEPKEMKDFLDVYQKQTKNN